MNVTVVTHTAGNRPAKLDHCKRSVAEQLDEGDEHRVVLCLGDLMKARWDSLSLGEYIAWVDDDDWVLNDSIRLCKQALESSGAGLAFTNETIGDGYCKRGPRYYSEVAMHPSTVHHLCMFKTSLVPRSVWEDYERIGSGLEWLIKSHVLMKHGGIHVPVDGYHWTQDGAQESKSKRWVENYNAAFPRLQAAIHGYAGDRVDEHIPVFVTAAQAVTI